MKPHASYYRISRLPSELKNPPPEAWLHNGPLEACILHGSTRLPYTFSNVDWHEGMLKH